MPYIHQIQLSYHLIGKEAVVIDKKAKKSEVVTLFLRLIDVGQQVSKVAYDEVRQQELLTNDLLHQLELGPTKERNKIATKIATCRKDRRYYKDRIEEMEPLNEWAQANKKAVNELKQVVGKMRKIEEKQETRTYVPRVLPLEEFKWQWDNSNK